MTLDILIVEDNPLNLELARDLLELVGHAVIVARSGAEFRQRLREGVAPSIVLMDILLPDASGSDLLREIRAERRYDHVPVVALTAHAVRGDVERLQEQGFSAVMTKPIHTRTFA